jgi:hypothetical protein
MVVSTLQQTFHLVHEVGQSPAVVDATSLPQQLMVSHELVTLHKSRHHPLQTDHSLVLCQIVVIAESLLRWILCTNLARRLHLQTSLRICRASTRVARMPSRLLSRTRPLS